MRFVFSRYVIVGLFLVSLLVSQTVCVPAHAQNIMDDISKEMASAAGDEGAGFDTSDTDANLDLRLKIATIIRYALSFVGTVFVALMVYAGILWMTAGGNDDQVSKSKKLIFQAVIGLFIVFSAYTITLLAYRLATGKTNDSRCRGSSSGQIDQANCGIGAE